MRALQIQDVSFITIQGPLLFRGGAPKTRGECVVLTGSSGAGKSTSACCVQDHSSLNPRQREEGDSSIWQAAEQPFF